MKKDKIRKKNRYYMNRFIIGATVWDFLRKKQGILYGAKAANIHLPPHLDRYTEDFDIYTKKPKKSAKELEKELDRRFGGDYFRVEAAKHKGTFKVVSNVTQKGVADFTKPEKRVGYRTTLDRIRYSKLQHLKKKLIESLRNPKAKFRHKKDREMLQRIKIYEKLYKW